MQFHGTFTQVILMAAALWVGATGVTSAQSTDTGTTAPSVEDQLSLGEDATKPSNLGEPYAKEVNGEWELRCLRTEDPENDPCQMYQLLNDGEGAPVAEVSLFRLPEGGQAVAGATIVVPLETSLQEQVTITVDGQTPRRYPFAFCNPIGCYARLGLTQEDVDRYKRGAAAEITIVPAAAPNQRVVLNLSLSGFTATFDKASVIEQR